MTQKLDALVERLGQFDSWRFHERYCPAANEQPHMGGPRECKCWVRAAVESNARVIRALMDPVCVCGDGRLSEHAAEPLRFGAFDYDHAATLSAAEEAIRE